jgi:ribosome recycling factor
MSSVSEIESTTKQKMEKTISDLQHGLQSVRTGRANISLLDGIRVDYYGTPTPLREVGQLHAPEAALLTVQPWDVSIIGAIEKAIRAAELGLNPQNDGKIIRLPIPPLTQDRRKEFVKKVHDIGEQHRVSVRNVRRDANDALKKLLKDKAISEDDEKRSLDQIQKMTESYTKKVDEAVNKKEKELMEV